MFGRTDNLIDLLTPYGLNDDEARVYLGLLENGVVTALQLSRQLHIGRTKVYRILDKLIAKELATTQFNEAGFKFSALEPAQLELMLTKREGELEVLRKNLPKVAEVLARRVGVQKPGSKVLYYQGKRGLSQVNWNVLEADGELLSYEVANADAYLPQAEAEKLRQALVEKKIMTRTITNRTKIEAFTQVTEMVQQWWQIRYVDPAVVEVNADVFLYNQVYAMCHYLDTHDVFCLEMHNKYLAAMQKQVFEVVWQQAKPLKVVSATGEAVLEGET